MNDQLRIMRLGSLEGTWYLLSPPQPLREVIFRPLTHENGVDTLIFDKNPYKCVNKARSFIYGSSLFALIFKIDTDFGARSRKLGESLVEQAGSSTLFTRVRARVGQDDGRETQHTGLSLTVGSRSRARRLRRSDLRWPLWSLSGYLQACA